MAGALVSLGVKVLTCLMRINPQLTLEHIIDQNAVVHNQVYTWTKQLPKGFTVKVIR